VVPLGIPARIVAHCDGLARIVAPDPVIYGKDQNRAVWRRPMEPVRSRPRGRACGGGGGRSGPWRDAAGTPKPLASLPDNAST